MNQYIRIPRGINVNNMNDHIFQLAIEAIGKKYSRVLGGKYRSNYARGKAYLSQEFGLSKTAIKKLHKPRNSVIGHDKYGVNYSNYVCLHLLKTCDIISKIIESIKKMNIPFQDMVFAASNGKYNADSKYVDVILEETLFWIRQGMMDCKNFCEFNRDDDACDEADGLLNCIMSIKDVIGEKQ